MAGERAKGSDWCSACFWDGSVMFDLPQLVREVEISWACWFGAQDYIDANGGQWNTMKHLAAGRQALEINGCFYLHDPSAAPWYLIDRFTRAIEKENPDFIEVDIEIAHVGGILQDPGRISDTAQQLTEGLIARFPEKRVEVYTRKDFILSYAPGMLKWMPKLGGNWWAHWLDYGLTSYRCTWEQLRNNQVRVYPKGEWADVSDATPLKPEGFPAHAIHQISSRRKLPAGVPVKIDHQYDWDLFNGSIEEMRAWCRKEFTPGTDQPGEVKMASIYDVNTPQSQRANIITLWSKQAHADIKKLSDGGTDAFILAMGGMDGDDAHKLYDDSAWRIRIGQVAAEKKPVIGMFTVAGDYYQRIQTSGEDVESMTRESNPILKKVIGNLRTDSSWTLDTISATDGKWLPVHGLLFALYKIKYVQGTLIGHDWQRRTLENILKPILFLQEAGKMPKLPIIVSGTPDFFKLYDFENSEFSRYMLDMHHQISLGVVQHYFAEAPTAIILPAAECWSYRVPDTFQFTIPVENSTPKPYTLYGYGSDMSDPLGDGHVAYHEASYNRFLFEGVTDSALKPTAPNTGFFCKNRDELYQLLNFKAVDLPPPVDPPAGEDDEELLTLQDWMAHLAALWKAHPELH